MKSNRFVWVVTTLVFVSLIGISCLSRAEPPSSAETESSPDSDRSPDTAGYLTLTPAGVVCEVGSLGKFRLTIPKLDGRNTHLGPIKESIQTDGQTWSGKFGPPFEGVTLTAKILEGGKVEFSYRNLPDDLRLFMTAIKIPTDSLVPGLAVTYDDTPPKTVTIPPRPDKKRGARLAGAHAQNVQIKWPSGESLTLGLTGTCWHGIQDARVWGKKYINVCLTPPARRDTPGGDTSTLVLTFSVNGVKPQE